MTDENSEYLALIERVKQIAVNTAAHENEDAHQSMKENSSSN